MGCESITHSKQEAMAESWLDRIVQGLAVLALPPHSVRPDRVSELSDALVSSIAKKMNARLCLFTS